MSTKRQRPRSLSLFLSDYSFRKKDHSGHGTDQHGSETQDAPDTDAECDIGRIRVKYRCETSVGTQIMKQTIIQGKNSQSRRKEYCRHGETLFLIFILPSVRNHRKQYITSRQIWTGAHAPVLYFTDFSRYYLRSGAFPVQTVHCAPCSGWLAFAPQSLNYKRSKQADSLPGPYRIR